VGNKVVAKPGMNWGKEIFLICITVGLWTPITILKWLMR
jgi:hypothetical protein